MLRTDLTLDLESQTLGDCRFSISFAWLDAFTPALDLQLEWPKTVRDYRRQIESHPSVLAELDDYGPRITAWMQSKGI